jgi:hypothetical protein
MNTELKIDILPVLMGAAVGGTGTARGMSKIMAADRCGRWSNLVEVNPEMDISGKGAKIGSVFHKLQHLYFEDKLSQYAIPVFEDTPRSEALANIAEGLRVFYAIRKLFPRESFGEFVAAERLFGEDPFERELMGQTFGYALTGQHDLVTRLDAAACERLQEVTKLELLPGIYIWDWKTSVMVDSHAVIGYPNSVQFNGYQVAWNVMNPYDQCSGMIGVNIARHKEITREKSVQWVHVPVPEEWVVDNIRDTIKEAHLSKQRNKRRLSACIHKYGVCEAMKLGICGLSVPDNELQKEG